MITKVYLVSCGEYSDYGIAEVFLDRDLAEKYCSIHNTSAQANDCDDYCIEEYKINTNPIEQLPPEGKVGYTVYMTKDGEFSYWRNDISFIKYNEIKNQMHFWPGNSGRRLYIPTYTHGDLSGRFGKHPHFMMSVFARNEEHAVKIVNEKRTQLIALNRWPDNETIKQKGDKRFHFGNGYKVEM